MNLQGKRALITGGSSGIGLAIAEGMLAKGAHIVITGRRPDVLSNAAALLRAGGRWVDFVPADVGTEKGRETTIKFALEKLGVLDIMINNPTGVRTRRLSKTALAQPPNILQADICLPRLLTPAP